MSEKIKAMQVCIEKLFDTIESAFELTEICMNLAKNFRPENDEVRKVETAAARFHLTSCGALLAEVGGLLDKLDIELTNKAEIEHGHSDALRELFEFSNADLQGWRRLLIRQQDLRKDWMKGGERILEELTSLEELP